jgi:hypothetical protein
MADRQEELADDVEARGRQQMMDVGDAAGDRILDRIMPRSASPAEIAPSASSKVAQGSGSASG